MASQYPPRKQVAFDLPVFIYKTDGTVIKSPGGLSSRVVRDFTATAGPTPTVTATCCGQVKVALTSTHMNADVVSVYVTSTTTGAVPATVTLFTTASTFNALYSRTQVGNERLTATRAAYLDAAITSRLASTATANANLVAINGDSTASHAATLQLKSLDIRNDDADSYGLSAYGTSAGAQFNGGESGSGFACTGGINGFEAVGDTGIGFLAEGATVDISLTNGSTNLGRIITASVWAAATRSLTASVSLTTPYDPAKTAAQQTTASSILAWHTAKRRVSATAQVLYAADDTTPISVQTLSDDGTSVTRGKAT